MGSKDQGLRQFAMAMKTPGRVYFDPLNSPKRARLRYGEDDESADDGNGGSGGSEGDPRVTNLKHSLAMVKGELGVRGAGAFYVTIHGGLQVSLASLTELELKLEQKASSAQVNGLLLDTHHCQAKSVEASGGGALGEPWGGHEGSRTGAGVCGDGRAHEDFGGDPREGLQVCGGSE